MNSFSAGDLLHVVAAVVLDRENRILIARRPNHLHQGGLWEFPGGKVEAGETAYDALCRELHEELGIAVTRARPLIRVPHDYGDRKVLLDVWRVEAFTGRAYGREGQPVQWVTADELTRFPFPAANRPIVTAARLPDAYAITPEPGSPSEWPHFLEQVEQSLRGGIRLLQLRAKRLAPGELPSLAEAVSEICFRYNASLLVNAAPEIVERLPGVGVHLNSAAIAEAERRPLPPDRWVAASCHSRTELEQASRIGVDFVVVSPVKPTATHPGAKPIGWEGLLELCELAPVPVFALGGMSPEDIPQAWVHGAQGIAAIRGLWPGAA